MWSGSLKPAIFGEPAIPQKATSSFLDEGGRACNIWGNGCQSGRLEVVPGPVLVSDPPPPRRFRQVVALARIPVTPRATFMPEGVRVRPLRARAAGRHVLFTFRATGLRGMVAQNGKLWDVASKATSWYPA